MHRHALPGSYQRSPVAVNFSQRGLILNALVQLGNRFLIGGKMMKRVQRVFGSLLFGTTVFGSSALREVAYDRGVSVRTYADRIWPVLAQELARRAVTKRRTKEREKPLPAGSIDFFIRPIIAIGIVR